MKQKWLFEYWPNCAKKSLCSNVIKLSFVSKFSHVKLNHMSNWCNSSYWKFCVDSSCGSWVIEKPVSEVIFTPTAQCVLTFARKRCFATFAHEGGLVRLPPGVWKRSVVELSGKDQRIALSKISRLVLVLGQHLTYLWPVKGQIFGKI